ncbi:ankyrin repeat-containing domain protein [Clohesyomyces aquaticus]|uniref:Ankyrin repeat-containing domain protein n=1 Tax=Clohesyomyces aquaticus TaxID=1231657 RepID=A0A1Y1ZF51_9PLEO|nr:ankyrin repeat-containing domain protein [Clohesyomyces aquaticus]
MVSRYRIEKRTGETGQVKRRGRPKKYSESWTKKLVLLRMCGLNLNDIVRILELQGDGTFAAKDRRPQQLVRQLLSDGKHRFRAPDKLAARRRAAFIRATFRKAAKHRPERSGCTSSPTESSSRTLISTTEGTQTHTGTSPRAAFGFSETLAMTHARSRDETLPEADEAIITPDSANDVKKSSDSILSASSRRQRFSAVFSQTSFSSSCVSDLLSLVGKRMSLSTFETSSRISMSTASIAEKDTSYAENNAPEILEQLRQTVVKANLALAQECCTLTERDPHLSLLRLGELKDNLKALPATQLLRDAFGNSELFFAARIGAPAEVMVSLISVTTDVNAVNADGQTFLFFLDPLHYNSDLCSCSWYYSPRYFPHSSKLECLIRKLQFQNFDFDHLDNHGRRFLSFLCSSPSFDCQWLLDLMSQDNEWQLRIRRLTQLRDATGLVMSDFMALHPKFDALSKDIRFKFRPAFAFNKDNGPLRGEDLLGEMPLHEYIQKEFLHSAPFDGVPLPFETTASDMNRYNTRSRTPVMDFLLQAFEHNIDEAVICSKVQQLVRYGANVNARSRAGSTILHFAAKKTFVQLLKTLLATNIQVDHCDKAGLSALDYAVKVLNRSRSVKAPAELTARSLKSAAKLLDVMSYPIGKDRTSGVLRPTNDFNERSQHTLQRLLLSQDKQQYPPSLQNDARNSTETF